MWVISHVNFPTHNDVIKWKHFPRYWPFVWGIHRSLVNSPHKVQWRGALMFSLICARVNDCKQSWGWWFGTPLRSLWRHCNQTRHNRPEQGRYYSYVDSDLTNNRADSKFALSQRETALLSINVSHWLGASLESALSKGRQQCTISLSISMLSSVTNKNAQHEKKLPRTCSSYQHNFHDIVCVIILKL